MPTRTRIKMCGTTSVADAAAAVNTGVDALGFIFFERSPRNIFKEDAKKIISTLPPFLDTVGVFVDESLETVCKIVDYCGINHVQLHGKESVAFCRELQKLMPSLRIIKAFRVKEELDKELLASYADYVSGYLFDTYTKGQEGGTGKVFRWELLENAELDRAIILAGGLTADNVVSAIKAVSPYAIDINSGVERSPGKKDHMLLATLINRVRTYER